MSAPLPAPEYRPSWGPNEVLMHLLLPGQAFARLGRPLPRWAWTIFGLVSANFLSFMIFWGGDRRWLLWWLPVAGAAAGHYFYVARGFTAWRPDRGQTLYALAALFVWMTPMLLAPMPGGQVRAVLVQERTLTQAVLVNATAAQAEGQPLSSGPCPAEFLPDVPMRRKVATCTLNLSDPQHPQVTVKFKNGHSHTEPQ